MNRKNWFSVISVVLILSIMLCFAVFSTRLNIKAKTTFQDNGVPALTVIIDAGHGGEDGGAQGSDGTLEKDINLNIALKLRDILIQSGFDVITVRDKDTAIGDELDTVRERKVSDLKKRLEIFNSNENNIVISIHQNKFEQSKYHGSQIFYSNNNSQSNILAESIRNSIVSLLQPENTRECKAADKNIYLLHNATIPAVIVECGFLSNTEELENLKQEEYQQKIAFAIYLGFLQYYAENRT